MYVVLFYVCVFEDPAIMNTLDSLHRNSNPNHPKSLSPKIVKTKTVLKIDKADM